MIVATIGLVTVAFVWVMRMRNAATMAQEPAGVAEEVISAARRLGFRRRQNSHPVDCVDDPKLATAALAIAFLELGGLPSPDQHDALLAALQRRCDLGLKDAEEMLILGRWLVTESRGPAPAVTRLCRRLAKIDRAGGFTPLMAVLNDTARAGRGGIVSERQKDALDEIARAFKAS